MCQDRVFNLEAALSINTHNNPILTEKDCTSDVRIGYTRMALTYELFSNFINGLHGFLRLEFQPENNIGCTVKLQTELDEDVTV
jgi:hypothetical protein